MTIDVDQLVSDMLARNLACAQVRNSRMQQQSVAAASPPQPSVAKPSKPKREPKPHKPPVSQPRYEVVTMLTRSELMALERLAREWGLTPGEALRWAWQAYAEEADCRRDG